MKAWVCKHQLLSFFGIAYAIAYISVFGFIYLNPGQPMASGSLTWFLFAFSPTISALLISWVVGGKAAVKQLFSGFTRWKVSAFWFLAATFLLTGPFVIALVYIAIGNPPTGLSLGWTIPMLFGQVLYQLFSGPLSEEAGWRGFALPRLQTRFSALVSSLILGVIWTCWHIPLFFVTGMTQMGIPFPIYLVLVLTLTVYMTWLYNNTGGSLLITVLAHFSFNLTGTLITGPVSLMPAMIFYMSSGPMLFLIDLFIIFYYGSRHLSKKAQGELPTYQDIPAVSAL